MPEIDYTPENKRFQTVEFDRLKLKRDERARVVLLERPTFAWVHTLKCPKILNGEPVKVEMKRRGETVIDFDMDFVGRPLCLGDYGTIKDKGVDIDNCPACARSAESDEVNPPERRFATNAIRYKIKSDGSLAQPFVCENVVWSFGEGVYNSLVEIANEHGSLVGRDLVLGPCENENWQKYKIGTGGKNVWTLDEKIQAIVQETHENNRAANLELACGRKQEARWMREDIEKIKREWRRARGEGLTQQRVDFSADAAELSAGLDNLMAHTTNGLDPQPAQQEQQVKEQPASAATPVAEQGQAVDFATLLADLNTK